MIETIVIAVLTCVSLICSILFFPKIKIKKFEITTYWIICFIGAILMLCFDCVGFDDVVGGLFQDSTINPIKILLLFISMTFLSIFLDEVGFFRFLANLLVKHFKSNQKLLFLTLYLMVAVLTVFTSNDIVILTFTPFICYFSKNAKINPIPYLVAEFAAANTYSMMLIIGNPTNIYLATSSNIDFLSYLELMWLPTLVCGVVQFGIMFLLFYKSLSIKIEASIEQVKIKSKLDLTFGLVSLFSCLILLILSSYISFDMWLICIICAGVLLISIIITHLVRHKSLKIILNTTKRLTFTLIPFVISMFVIVLALNKEGITEIIGNFFGEDYLILKYGTSSFLASNLINNIPMSVLFSNIINLPNEVLRNQAIYSTIIGSNLGAFFTPVGALAGIMFMGLVKKQDIKFSFLMFLKYGSIVMIPTLFVALGMLSVFFY